MCLPDKKTKLRHSPDVLKVLKDSINRIGLMSPVLLQKEKRKYYIVDGWARVVVYKQLGKKTIESRLIHENKNIKVRVAAISLSRRANYDE